MILNLTLEGWNGKISVEKSVLFAFLFTTLSNKTNYKNMLLFWKKI